MKSKLRKCNVTFPVEIEDSYKSNHAVCYLKRFERLLRVSCQRILIGNFLHRTIVYFINLLFGFGFSGVLLDLHFLHRQGEAGFLPILNRLILGILMKLRFFDQPQFSIFGRVKFNCHLCLF